MTSECLDEALLRLHQTGPEFDGWLSNHGPMAAEALARHGHGDQIHSWLDGYNRRLEAAPTATGRITDWRHALGVPSMLGAWLAFFENELADNPWTGVLTTWWPRLLPGIAAGATHGVIRTGHAVRALREGDASQTRIAELAQALGYWAARWQPVPCAAAPTGRLDAAAAIAGLPQIPRQTGDISARLGQLGATGSWVDAQQALAPSDDWQAFLRDLVIASVLRYSTHSHGNPVMLVHASTAPNAVLRTLPSLPPSIWRLSATAAWSASAAIHSAYTPRDVRPSAVHPPISPADAFGQAASHGDEHVIKLADTALDVHEWTGDTKALSSIVVATSAVAPL